MPRRKTHDPMSGRVGRKQLSMGTLVTATFCQVCGERLTRASTQRASATDEVLKRRAPRCPGGDHASRFTLQIERKERTMDSIKDRMDELVITTVALQKQANRLNVEARTIKELAGKAEAPMEPSSGDFGWAIRELRKGVRVVRRGWNGPAMWIGLNQPDDERMSLPYIFMCTMNGELIPWVASQTDMLTDDWVRFVRVNGS